MAQANPLEKSDFYLHRNNNFDSLRIIAAYTVVFAHSIPLSYGPRKLDILWSISKGQATFGYIAIQIFFIISGYLITGSYINTLSREMQKSLDYKDAQLKGMRRFLRARLLRLAPALLFVLFLIAFGLGPCVTSVPLTKYFLSHLPYFTAIGLSDHLPGVFSQNPFSSGVDGSLWTLRYEALCYVAVLCFGILRLLRLDIILPVFFVILAARLYYGAYAGLDLGTVFAAGAVIRLWRPPMNMIMAGFAGLLCVLSIFTGGYHVTSFILGSYLVIFLGISPSIKLPNLARYGDISYGVYIYAWPIQQTVSYAMGKHADWIINNLITIPIVSVFAFTSWYLIERPSLAHKDRAVFNFL